MLALVKVALDTHRVELIVLVSRMDLRVTVSGQNRGCQDYGDSGLP